MKYLLLLIVFITGCATTTPIQNQYGKVVTVKEQGDVLKVIAENPNAKLNIVQEDGKYLVFITPKSYPNNPIVISSTDLTELQILINQYADRGWYLSGSISTASKLGKITYFATVTK